MFKEFQYMVSSLLAVTVAVVAVCWCYEPLLFVFKPIIYFEHITLKPWLQLSVVVLILWMLARQRLFPGNNYAIFNSINNGDIYIYIHIYTLWCIILYYAIILYYTRQGILKDHEFILGNAYDYSQRILYIISYIFQYSSAWYTELYW